MTRRLAIVVPAKDTAQAKSRLAPLLSPETRRALADALFRQTLGVLRNAKLDASIFVVTDSPRLAEEAGEFGAEVIRDSGTSLTEAVDLATRQIARAGFYFPARDPLGHRAARRDGDPPIAGRDGHHAVGRALPLGR